MLTHVNGRTVSSIDAMFDGWQRRAVAALCFGGVALSLWGATSQQTSPPPALGPSF